MNKDDYQKLRLQLRILKEIGCLKQYVEARKKCGYTRIFDAVYADRTIYGFIDSSLTWAMTGNVNLWRDLFYSTVKFNIHDDKAENFNKMLLNDQEIMNYLREVVESYK